MKKLLLAFIFLAVAAPAFSETGKEDDFRMKTMEGEIAGKTRANLSIVYKQEGASLYEAVIPVDEKIKLKGYKSFMDIRDGDVVKVDFKEFYKKNDKGEEVRTGRTATSIQLVKNSVAGKLISKN